MGGVGGREARRLGCGIGGSRHEQAGQDDQRQKGLPLFFSREFLAGRQECALSLSLIGQTTGTYIEQVRERRGLVAEDKKAEGKEAGAQHLAHVLAPPPPLACVPSCLHHNRQDSMATPGNSGGGSAGPDQIFLGITHNEGAAKAPSAPGRGRAQSPLRRNPNPQTTEHEAATRERLAVEVSFSAKQ
jgi:hypothetical protein